ncbi:hypothetical protein HF086_017333 [Spodoptera exigua]|uniref:DUF4455 domain-containing protein n=1 Tax=Spodoptera exigua TaxID=7107 RepID=A0A922M2I3_SPOEX|nr:hypothetical protein HF086_017333 [Spodoptera exigua]
MSYDNKNFLPKINFTNKTKRISCTNICLSKRVARQGYPEDIDAVASLPDDWKPKHSGPILANYLKQREKDHQNVIDEITSIAAEINEDINQRARSLAGNLLSYIQQNQRDIDCFIDKCDNPEAPLTEESRDKAYETVRKIMTERIEECKNYKKEALVLERERADKLRILLRSKFQRLVAIGHKIPKDLIHEFDQRIYEINQQLLINTKTYSEVEADFRGLSDEGLMRARSSLNQLCLGIGMALRGRSALIWCKDLKESRQRSQSALDRTLATEPLPGNIFDDVGEFDAVISRLVQVYRNAVLKVFSGFSTKLTELEKDLGSHLEFCGPIELPKINLAELNRLIERPLQRLSASYHRKKGCGVRSNKTLFDMTGADVLSMQKSVWSLGESLRETCSILNHAGHLWDAHLLRSALAQKLTIAAVEDLLTSHDAVELANEVPFNIAFEQMRCAPDTEKLQHHYDTIVTMLYKTGEMYLQHSEAELGRLEEFMKFPPVMASTLLAEFDVFLEKYPRTPIKVTSSATSLPAVSTPTRTDSILSSIQMPLPRAIFQTELQELSLKNWRNGFIESFAGNISIVPEELKHQARLWVEERGAALQMRYSLKIVSHTIRMERVKAARDLRLAELEYHETRLESHVNAIFELLDRLPREASEFIALDSPALYPFEAWIDRIKINIQSAYSQILDPEAKKLRMKSYAPRLAKHRQLFEESLNTVSEDFKQLLEHRIQEARISNVRFMSQIKLFSEGGTYAALEATKTCNALGKAADSLELCINKSLDAMHQRRSQLLALADQQVYPLQRIVEEFAKPHSKQATKSPGKTETKKSSFKKK